MRVNINMDEELVKKVDEVAKKMYVSRSSYIAFAVSQKIQADETLANMPKMIDVMNEAVLLEKSKLNEPKKCAFAGSAKGRCWAPLCGPATAPASLS